MYGSPDRADFIKASIDPNIDGFYQDFGSLVYINEDKAPLDVNKIPELTDEELSWLYKNKEKARLQPDNVARQKKIKVLYLDNKIKEAHERTKVSVGRDLEDREKDAIRKDVENSVRRLIEKKELDRLHPIYVLEDKTIKMITVDDILKDEKSAKRYHGMSCASVLDPFYIPGKEYRGENQTDNNSNSNSWDISANKGRLSGIDFTRAKIFSCDNPPCIMDQAHGGVKFFFDIEFFNIKKLEKKRKDKTTTILPLWNLTDIANCFVNQYEENNKDDKENFGNVLKELAKDLNKGFEEEDEKIDNLLFDVFNVTLKNNKLNKRIWSNLTGYGPNLYDFMHRNLDKFESVSLQDNKILTVVNKIDVKIRYDILDSSFYKTKGNKLESIIAEKTWSEDFGWYFSLGTIRGVTDFQNEDKYYVNVNGTTKKLQIMEYWLNSPYKKRYSGGIEFRPVKNKVAIKEGMIKGTSDMKFNLYTGLNLVPKPKKYEPVNMRVCGSRKTVRGERGGGGQNGYRYIGEGNGWDRINYHINYVLCNDDKEKYEYILNWIANMFQHPYRMGETLLAFQGSEGIGKNTFWDMLIRAFGKFAVCLTDPGSMTGNFNSGVAEKILVVLNEAFWEGDKKGHSILKGFVTDEFVESKKKHVDSIMIKNTSHLVIMTNHEAVAPMSTGDRRIVTFDVSDIKARDREYFGKLRSEMEEGGSEAFVYSMLNRDISKFNIGNIPNSNHSESAINSIMNTAEPWLRWLYECLQDNELYGHETNNLVLSTDIIEVNKQKMSMLMRTDNIDEIIDIFDSTIPISVLFKAYNNWKSISNMKRCNLTSNKFTRNIKGLLFKQKKVDNPTLDEKEIAKMVHRKVGINAVATNCMVLDNLEYVRGAFETYINKVVDWNDIYVEDSH